MAAVGVGIAILLLRGNTLFVIVSLIVAIVVALIFDKIGQMFLPGRPRTALIFMEFWIIAPAMVAAVASGSAVVLVIRLVPTDDLDLEVTGLIKATATAAVAFLTSAFVSWVGEKDSSRISGRIRRHFFEVYKRADEGQPCRNGKKCFKAESRGELAVYSTMIEGATGWGLTDRWKRANIIAEELTSGNSDP